VLSSHFPAFGVCSREVGVMNQRVFRIGATSVVLASALTALGTGVASADAYGPSDDGGANATPGGYQAPQGDPAFAADPSSTGYAPAGPTGPTNAAPINPTGTLLSSAASPGAALSGAAPSGVAPGQTLPGGALGGF
jgi:hypothetical protein